MCGRVQAVCVVAVALERGRVGPEYGSGLLVGDLGPESLLVGLVLDDLLPAVGQQHAVLAQGVGALARLLVSEVVAELVAHSVFKIVLGWFLYSKRGKKVRSNVVLGAKKATSLKNLPFFFISHSSENMITNVSVIIQISRKTRSNFQSSRTRRVI